jgi:hypothetical protein
LREGRVAAPSLPSIASFIAVSSGLPPLQSRSSVIPNQ